jgi:hypothetical protein
MALSSQRSVGSAASVDDVATLREGFDRENREGQLDRYPISRQAMGAGLSGRYLLGAERVSATFAVEHISVSSPVDAPTAT